MSNFKCEQCGTDCTEAPSGYYATGCIHHPPDCCQQCGRLIESYRQIQNPGTEICGHCAAVRTVDFHEEER